MIGEGGKPFMKLAVIFPGIGYHVDKPLLYYSRKLALQYGYQVINVPYGNFPADVKGSEEKMREAFQSALSQTEEILKDVSFENYEEIIFISKSVGTAVASAYGQRHQLHTRNLYYTPVEASFRWMEEPGIVFHGTRDSWADTERIQEESERRGFPLYLTEGANHSLETGDTGRDLENLIGIMKRAEEYLKC